MGYFSDLETDRFNTDRMETIMTTRSCDTVGCTNNAVAKWQDYTGGISMFCLTHDAQERPNWTRLNYLPEYRGYELSGLDIDAALTGYLECQLWAQRDTLFDDGEDMTLEGIALAVANGAERITEHSESLDGFYGADDIDPAYIASVRAELIDFANAHPLALRLYLNTTTVLGNMRNVHDSSQFGHDFYLTREHHGAGFWDRGLGELGDYLTEHCQAYGEANLLVDGAVCSVEGQSFTSGTLYGSSAY